MATLAPKSHQFSKYLLFNFIQLPRLYSTVAQFPNRVKIVEVGPRDGLQNEPNLISTDVKLELIDRLGCAGLTTIESTSFVSAKWVPQLADSAIVMKNLKRKPGVTYPTLVPNLKGLDAAVDAGVEEIAVFTAASEAFSVKNTNCSVAESLKRLEQVATTALDRGLKVRGYVSCVVGCPYQGYISPQEVLPVVQALIGAGCYEVSLGDTIGVGNPGTLKTLLEFVTQSVNPDRLAIHCHDTYGQALVNVLTALKHGIKTVDSSVAGLGGCPYAPGASGNVATEDLLYMLHGMGIKTGVNLRKILETGKWICSLLKRQNGSKVSNAYREDNIFLSQDSNIE